MVGGLKTRLGRPSQVNREKVKEKSHCPVGVAFLCKNNAFKSASSPLITKGNVIQGFPFLSRELLDRVAFPLAWQAASPGSSSFRIKKIFRKAGIMQCIFHIYLSWCSFFQHGGTTKPPISSKRTTGSQSLHDLGTVSM